MNRERLLAVADQIEADPEHFAMHRYFRNALLISVCEGKPRHACGTSACVAGTAIMMFGEWKYERVKEWDEDRGPEFTYARELLDLTPGEAAQLFFWRMDSNPSAASVAQYIRDYVG